MGRERNHPVNGLIYGLGRCWRSQVKSSQVKYGCLPYGCLLFMYRLDLTWRQKGRPPRPRVSLRVSWSFWNPCLRVGRSAPLPVNGMQLEEHCHSLSVRSCYVAGHAATPRRTGPHPRSPQQASKHEGRSLRFALGLHRTSTPLKGRLCSSAAPSKHKCTRRVCVEVMRSIFKTQPAPYASDVCFESLSVSIEELHDKESAP